jgi:hypothetical protein
MNDAIEVAGRQPNGARVNTTASICADVVQHSRLSQNLDQANSEHGAAIKPVAAFHAPSVRSCPMTHWSWTNDSSEGTVPFVVRASDARRAAKRDQRLPPRFLDRHAAPDVVVDMPVQMNLQ